MSPRATAGNMSSGAVCRAQWDFVDDTGKPVVDGAESVEAIDARHKRAWAAAAAQYGSYVAVPRDVGDAIHEASRVAQCARLGLTGGMVPIRVAAAAPKPRPAPTPAVQGVGVSTCRNGHDQRGTMPDGKPIGYISTSGQAMCRGCKKEASDRFELKHGGRVAVR